MFKETITDKDRKLRVFTDTDCSEYLNVWYSDGNKMKQTDAISEIRLIYNVIDDAHCIIWKKKVTDGKTEEIYAHTGVDDGEDKFVIDGDGNKVRFSAKQAPTLVLNGVFEKKHLTALADDFLSRAKGIDKNLSKFVYDKLMAFPEKQFVLKPHN